MLVKIVVQVFLQLFGQQFNLGTELHLDAYMCNEDTIVVQNRIYNHVVPLNVVALLQLLNRMSTRVDQGVTYALIFVPINKLSLYLKSRVAIITALLMPLTMHLPII